MRTSKTLSITLPPEMLSRAAQLAHRRLLALHPFQGIAIVTPAAFLTRIARELGRRQG